MGIILRRSVQGALAGGIISVVIVAAENGATIIANPILIPLSLAIGSAVGALLGGGVGAATEVSETVYKHRKNGKDEDLTNNN